MEWSALTSCCARKRLTESITVFRNDAKFLEDTLDRLCVRPVPSASMSL